MPSATTNRPLNRRSDRDRRQVLLAGLLVLLGLGIVAHPLYLWPHSGQVGYALDIRQTHEVPASSIEYEALPPASRAAFDQAIAGKESVLWSGEDDHAIEFYWDRPAIHYDGAYYRATLLHGGQSDSIQPLVRWVLTATGVFCIVFGGLVLATATWTPFTPLRGLLMPAALTIAFVGTNAYDVLFSGVQRAVVSFPSEVAVLIPVTSIALTVGSAVTAGRDSRIISGGLVAIVFLGVLLGGSPNPVSLVILAGFLMIGSAPWFVVGYNLTTRVDRSSP